MTSREINLPSRLLDDPDDAFPFVFCRKYAGPVIDIENMENHQKIPLTAYGRPGFFTVFWQLVHRSWGQLNLFRWEGFKTLFLKLLLMPMFFFLLWIFYFNAFKDVSSSRLGWLLES